MDASPSIRKPRRPQRLRTKASKHLRSLDPHVAGPIDTVQRATMMTVRAACLADPTFGAQTRYTGSPTAILNGISSLSTPDGGNLEILPGTPVRVCTRPVIPFGTTEPSVRIHFSMHTKNHTSDCMCGACGCGFNLTNVAPEACSCGTEVFDEGKQPCAIM